MNNKVGPLNDYTEHKYGKLLELAVDCLTSLSNFQGTTAVSWELLPMHPPHTSPHPSTHPPSLPRVDRCVCNVVTFWLPSLCWYSVDFETKKASWESLWSNFCFGTLNFRGLMRRNRFGTEQGRAKDFQGFC